MTYYILFTTILQKILLLLTVIHKLCTPTQFPHTGKIVEEKSVMTIFLASIAADLIIVAAVLISYSLYRRHNTLVCKYYRHNWKRPSLIDMPGPGVCTQDLKLQFRTECLYPGVTFMSLDIGMEWTMPSVYAICFLITSSIHTLNLQSRVDLCRYHSNRVTSEIP